MNHFPGVQIPPADVSLVLMPYAALERPSIGLSILKSVLGNAGISATVVYGNILFADEIGAYAHSIVGKTQSHSLAGEWTFSQAAFPGFETDEAAYFQHVHAGLQGMMPLVWAHGGRGQMPAILRSVRGRADGFIDRLARRILAAGPRIVGCSSTFQQHCASLALLRRIKELDPSVNTVMGGANCEASMGFATHKECPWVDYVISGEAEEPFLLLCQRLLGRTDRRSSSTLLPMLSVSSDWPDGVFAPEHRATNYETLHGGTPRARLEDMNRSPMPEYDDYFRTLAESPTGLFVKPGLLLETSRGCWWGAASHCTFCGLNGTSMKFRSKHPDRVMEEFTTLAEKWQLRSFEVVDNILDLAYMRSVVPELAERRDGYHIFYETKANLTRAQVRLLADAGIRWLQPGIESLDDGVLKAIAKGTTARQNLQLLKWAKDYGTYVLWIFLYDIPGESDEAYGRMAEWLPLISHLQPPSGFSFIQYNRFSPYHTRAKDYGLNVSPDRSYAFVYPWPEESLNDFAYFFDDYTVTRHLIQGVEDIPQRPGLTQLYRAVSAWQALWQGHMNAGLPVEDAPNLVARSDDGKLFISDTRPCRVADDFVLGGMHAAVFESCDEAHNERGLLRELSIRVGRAVAWDEVAPVVAELCAQRLILALDGYFFSLACAPGLHPMSIGHYPGGRLRTMAEAQAAELLLNAQAQSNAFPHNLR